MNLFHLRDSGRGPAVSRLWPRPLSQSPLDSHSPTAWMKGLEAVQFFTSPELVQWFFWGGGTSFFLGGIAPISTLTFLCWGDNGISGRVCVISESHSGLTIPISLRVATWNMIRWFPRCRISWCFLVSLDLRLFPVFQFQSLPFNIRWALRDCLEQIRIT